MRIHLSMADLTRIGLGGADPAWETAASLRVLQTNGAAFDRWRRLVRWSLPAHADRLLWLCGPGAPAPTFLVPMTGESEMDGVLAEISRTAPARLAAGVLATAAGRPLPRWAQELANGSTAALGELTRLLGDYHRLAIAPHWPDLTARVDADRDLRTRILRDGGVSDLLTSLRPAVRWHAPVLETDHGGELHLAGTGLLLVPTWFTREAEVIPSPAGDPARLAYPVAHIGNPVPSARRGPSKKALAALIGPTRAAALATMATGCSTSELAERLGVTPSAVSKHTAVLRDAGLISTHRDRNTVLHSLTPLGASLLADLGSDSHHLRSLR